MQSVEGILSRALNRPFSAYAHEKLETVKVMVLDSGIDASHPELAGRVERSVTCSADEQGAVTIVDTNPNENNDVYGHGTAVGSIIARIAPNAALIDVRVLGTSGLGSPEALLGGFEYANRSDARILNMSVAVGSTYVGRFAPLAEFAYRRGKVVVAATRNRPIEDEGYPASLATCAGVGNAGRGPADRWFYQSRVIEFSGHGVDVPVAAAGGGYTSKSGTSLATPIITGVVAVILGAYPELTPFEIKSLLKAFAA